MFDKRLREAIAASGYSIRELSEKSGTSQRTINNWLRKEGPAMPRADEAAKVADILGTTVEALVFGRDSRALPLPFGDIIQDLNTLPEYRLDDVRRLIAPWANEARGAAMQIIDIVADLKVLPGSRLEDLRRLVKPWADEARSGSQERAEKAG